MLCSIEISAERGSLAFGDSMRESIGAALAVLLCGGAQQRRQRR
jgi:hypothetical protein